MSEKVYIPQYQIVHIDSKDDHNTRYKLTLTCEISLEELLQNRLSPGLKFQKIADKWATDILAQLIDVKDEE